MKTIFTLLFASLLGTASFAADFRPTVTIHESKNFTVVVDGKSFNTGSSTINVDYLRNGFHKIEVFKANTQRGWRQPKLIASSTFRLNNADMLIDIDRSGNIQISEQKQSPKLWNNQHDMHDQRNAPQSHRF